MYQGYNVNRPKSRRASISFTDPMVNDTKNLLGASLGFDMRGGGSAMYYSPLETTSAYGSVVWGRIFKWPDDFFRGTWRFMVRRRSYSGSQADLESYAGGKTKTDGISFVQTIRRDSRITSRISNNWFTFFNQLYSFGLDFRGVKKTFINTLLI